MQFSYALYVILKEAFLYHLALGSAKYTRNPQITMANSVNVIYKGGYKTFFSWALLPKIKLKFNH